MLLRTVLAELINFCLKRMKYDLGGAPQNLISKYRFWISTSGKYLEYQLLWNIESLLMRLFSSLQILIRQLFRLSDIQYISLFSSNYLLIADPRLEHYTHTLQLNVTLSPGLTVRFDISVESINGSPHVLTETNKNNETLRAQSVLPSDKFIVSKMSKRLREELRNCL